MTNLRGQTLSNTLKFVTVVKVIVTVVKVIVTVIKFVDVVVFGIVMVTRVCLYESDLVVQHRTLRSVRLNGAGHDGYGGRGGYGRRAPSRLLWWVGGLACLCFTNFTSQVAANACTRIWTRRGYNRANGRSCT